MSGSGMNSAQQQNQLQITAAMPFYDMQAQQMMQETKKPLKFSDHVRIVKETGFGKESVTSIKPEGPLEVSEDLEIQEDQFDEAAVPTY